LEGVIVIGLELVQQPIGSKVEMYKRGTGDWTLVIWQPGLYVFEPTVRNLEGTVKAAERFTVTVTLPVTPTWDVRTPVP
jgi:hypothetical protein